MTVHLLATAFYLYHIHIADALVPLDRRRGIGTSDMTPGETTRKGGAHILPVLSGATEAKRCQWREMVMNVTHIVARKGGMVKWLSSCF